MLIIPLNAFPWVLNSIVEAFVSKKRFDKFFSIKNMDLFSLYRLNNCNKKTYLNNKNKIKQFFSI